MADGLRSHQIFVASSITSAWTSTSTSLRYSEALAKVSGIPVLGNSLKTARRYEHSPERWPCQNGEDVDSASRCGRK